MTSIQLHSDRVISNTSLIISSRNRPGLLEDTVQSVLQGDQLPSEIVIVDQSESSHPTLRSAESVCGCAIRYLWSSSRGLSVSRNTGIAAARFGALAILDDDMFVDKSWFGSLVGPIVHETEMVVTGQVSESREDLPGTFAPSTQAPQPPAVYEGRSPEASIYAGNMALCRAVLDDIGLFDERLGAGTSFPSSEDNDLTFRVLEAGYRLHYAPQAVVYHRAWRAADQYLRLRWDYGVGQGAFYAKYLSLRDRYMLKRMLRDVQMHFLSVPWVAITDRRRALGNAVYALGVMSGAARWLVTVRKSH